MAAWQTNAHAETQTSGGRIVGAPPARGHFRFVAWVQPRRGRRIDIHESRIEVIESLVLRLLPQGSPHNRIGRWCVAQALEEGPHIEPCATHYQGKAAVSIEALDLIDRLGDTSCIK